MYEGRCHSVDHVPNKDKMLANNQHILQQIIKAAVLGAKQELILRCHREKNDQNLDESRQQPPKLGNFNAIVKDFSKHHDILRNHFFKGLRNT